MTPNLRGSHGPSARVTPCHSNQCQHTLHNAFLLISHAPFSLPPSLQTKATPSNVSLS